MSAEERADLQRYLDEKQLQPKLNRLLNDLVHETPKAPLAWMAAALEAPAPPGPTTPSAADAKLDPSIGEMLARWNVALTFQGQASAAATGAPAEASGASSAPETAAKGGEGGAGAPASDKEAKKAAKAEEKRKKEEEKERKRKEREEAERRKQQGPEVPTVTLLDFMEHSFGNLQIQSHTTTERTWGNVGELTPALSGTSVWLRVRLHNSRKQSAKLGFLVLRQRLFTVQAVVQGKDLAAFACGLPKESVLDVYAEVTTPPEPVASCTQSGVELSVTRVYCITQALARLPLRPCDLRNIVALALCYVLSTDFGYL